MIPELPALRLASTARRGSSWPVVVETPAGRYLTKLTGAGHGAAALVAEVIVAALAERLGLNVPARALVRIPEGLATPDQDPELQELLARSVGLGLGFEWLEGARDFRSEDVERVGADEAAITIWLDALVCNPDRTRRSPNLMIRRGRLHLIDHGSALPFHHDWARVSEASPRRRAAALHEHVLAPRGLSAMAAWDELLAAALGRDALRAAVDLVPDDFLRPLLGPDAGAAAVQLRREAYVAFLWKRLRAPRPFLPDPPVAAATLAPAG